MAGGKIVSQSKEIEQRSLSENTTNMQYPDPGV